MTDESLIIAVATGLVLFGLMCAYDRWLWPLIERRWVHTTLAKTLSGQSPPLAKQSEFGMSIDTGGISVNRLRPTFEFQQFVAWDDILRVTAFKRDRFTVDCICIIIATKDGTTTEVNEEMEGWEVFTEALPKYLPGCKVWMECFSQVAFPAFATNETLLYERENLRDVAIFGGA